jgi:hypothetical protein
MKHSSLLFLVSLIAAQSASARVTQDSLVRFRDLRFHSDFEREAVTNFVLHRRDTFNLFLAVDENMSAAEAGRYRRQYLEIFDELAQRKAGSRKMGKKIKVTYADVHARFLKKYVESEYFPALFRDGTYNCVSASMLYALVYGRLSVPFKVMASASHVYLVANPGPKSTVIETTNPGLEQQIFTGEFKQQYVSYLRESKMISEEEYRSRSVDEIFEAKFKEVKESEFNNLPGFQYMNKAISRLQDNNVTEAYELCQKAYFFYPDNQVRTLLYASLLLAIGRCNFLQVKDIDYLAQLSRFENSDPDLVAAMFNNILAYHLQYTDKGDYCDSLYHRLYGQVADTLLRNELSFDFYMKMASYCNSYEQTEYYAGKAVKLKGNHREANQLLIECIRKKLQAINEPLAELDTVVQLDLRYNNETIDPVLQTYRSIALLRVAREYYRKKASRSGDEYLAKFEDSCDPPVSDRSLIRQVEATYATASAYYFNRNYKAKSRELLNRGLLYVPESELLRSTKYRQGAR